MKARNNGTPRLRVALDTTYAGMNSTGVGLYSTRLAAGLRKQSATSGLELTCYGPSCGPGAVRNCLLGTLEEWPTYTHGVLPVRLLAFRPQVVHSTSHIGPLWGPGRLIVTVHDLIFMRFPEDYQPGWLALTKALLPSILRRATAIIADSHATRHEIEHFFGIRGRKIVVIYPGIDAEAHPTSRQAHIAPEKRTNAPYILCLGPWVRRKNLTVVMQAFSLLAPRLPELRLVITGERPRGMRGYSEQELLSHVPSDFRSRVQLVGYVSQEEKQSLIAGASVLCYPSRLEGFGLPPLEAMALGTPVVAAASPAVVEVTGGAALALDPDDPARWADSIELLMAVPGAADRQRVAGIRHSALFTWERCAQQTARLYRLVASRGA